MSSCHLAPMLVSPPPRRAEHLADQLAESLGQEAKPET